MGEELPAVTQSDGGPTTSVEDAAASEGGSTADGGLDPVRSVVAVGASFACVLGKDKSVSCWGSNSSGELGKDPATTPACSGVGPCSPTPSVVLGLSNIERIAAGDDFACALDQGGNVWCWGNNGAGQLAGAQVASSFTPVKVYVGAKQIAAGGKHACLITTDDVVKCWGANTCHEIGSGGAVQNQVGQIAGLPKLAQVSLGVDEICGVTLDNALLCWGADHLGSLGHDVDTGQTCGSASLPNDPLPKSVQAANDLPLEDISDVHVGASFACAKRKDGHIACWGDNRSGALGQGVPDTSPHKRAVDLPAFVGATLAVGGGTACAIAATKVFCWGEGQYGTYGTGAGAPTCATANCRGLATEITTMAATRDVFVGATSFAAIKSDLGMWTWGRNASAQLSLAASAPVSTPTKVTMPELF